MAFALYFGAYHAPAHIWRVWRSWRESAVGRKLKPAVVVSGLVATLFVNWMLGAGLWLLFSPDCANMPEPAAALRRVIMALAAVTVPHLQLISASVAFLAARQQPSNSQQT